MALLNNGREIYIVANSNVLSNDLNIGTVTGYCMNSTDGRYIYKYICLRFNAILFFIQFFGLVTF